MCPISCSVARTEQRLNHLTVHERRCVARASEATAAERATARLAVTSGLARGRLTAAEAVALGGVLDNWSVTTLAQRIVCWQALAEIAC